MAADIWKINDIYGRVSYYEDEKKFNKRFKKLLIESQLNKKSYEDNGRLPTWYREVKGYRIINDTWSECKLDEFMVQTEVAKIQAKMLLRRTW